MYYCSETFPSRTKKVVVNYLVKDLLEYLPHRPPMVWVEEVIEMGEIENRFYGSCWTDVSEPSLYCVDGRIKGSVAIELCAQTYGFSKACFHHVNNIDDTPSVTYLTGVRDCETNFEKFPENNEGRLRVDVVTTRRMDHLTFLEGKVTGEKTGTLYGKVTLQVYTA